MGIDFFSDAGKTSSNKRCFGLCDDIPPAKTPAYINEDDSSKWIGQVDNPASIVADFYAIDNCITISRSNGDMESRCDGMLLSGNKLTFVELKDRIGKGWLAKAGSQLTITINIFKANHDISVYKKVDACACNKQRPSFSTTYSNVLQKFRNDTGLILQVQRNILI